MKERLLRSLVIGVIAASILTGFTDRFRHAALVASAAKSAQSGGHQTVASILAAGFAGTALGVTALVFVLATLGERRQARGQRRPDSRRRPRSRAGAGR